MAWKVMRWMAKLINNIPQLIETIHNNVPAALEAIKDDGIDSVHYMMLHGYSEPHRHWVTGSIGTDIYDTGALYKDVQGLVNNEEQRVTFGNTLYYASYVHEGTRKVHARPYLEDGITLINDFAKKAAKELKKGIE